MVIKMTLLSDTIFGNGESIPGGEDISVLTDEYGFPFFKGGTLKGIFREELKRFLEFRGLSKTEIYQKVGELLGHSGDDDDSNGKLVFTDLTLSPYVKKTIIGELGAGNPMRITDIFSNVRTFTAIEDETGIVKEGSLRMARCVNKGNVFYGEIDGEDNETVKSVLGMIKYIGTMRNRGFGNVEIKEVP